MENLFCGLIFKPNLFCGLIFKPNLFCFYLFSSLYTSFLSTPKLKKSKVNELSEWLEGAITDDS